LPWPPGEEVARVKDEETVEAKNEKPAEVKEEDAMTGLQSLVMDVCDHDTISVDEVHIETNSRSPSEPSIKDDDEENHVLGDDIETEEYVMSQEAEEVQEIEEIPNQPPSDMVLGSSK
jgi:dTDP-glucose pyrophosphorylase